MLKWKGILSLKWLPGCSFSYSFIRLFPSGWRSAVFKGVLQTAPLLRPFVATLAWAIPVSEIAVSLLLFLPRHRLLGLYASLGLLVLFTLYLAFMLLYSPHLPCSCGGVISHLSWPAHLLFNAFFIGMNVIAIWLNKPPFRSNILYNQA